MARARVSGILDFTALS